MKKIYFFLLCGLLCTANLNAQTSGTTGSLTWSIANNTLTISGNGEMPNYSSGSAPWHSHRNSLTAVRIENGVTSIGNFAFFSSDNLTSVTIGKSVTSIGNSAFEWCSKIIEIINYAIVPQEVGNRAFFGLNQAVCSLRVLNEAVDAYILADDWNGFVILDEEGCLRGLNWKICERTLFISGAGEMQGFSSEYSSSTGTYVTTAPWGVHQNLFTTVVIEDGITSIGSTAFRGCGITSVSIPNSVATIKFQAFSDNWLTSIDIPNSVTSIEINAFRNNRFTSVTIPESVVSIGGGAFGNCRNLTTVNFNAINCTAMGERGMYGAHNLVFSNCNNLTKIKVQDKFREFRIFVTCFV